MEMKFTTANFEEEVLKSEIPVLVDFYADWCGPCQMMAPVIGQLAGEYEGRVKIGKLYEFDGLNRVEVQSAEIGSIVAVSGIPDIHLSLIHI